MCSIVLRFKAMTRLRYEMDDCIFIGTVEDKKGRLHHVMTNDLSTLPLGLTKNPTGKWMVVTDQETTDMKLYMCNVDSLVHYIVIAPDDRACEQLVSKACKGNYMLFTIDVSYYLRTRYVKDGRRVKKKYMPKVVAAFVEDDEATDESFCMIVTK